MDTKPNLSVVIPIYIMHGEGVNFLKRCLDSFKDQTYEDYEIIISDDSADDQLKLACSHPKVKYFKNDGPGGMANNTNHAISKANGEIIKILYQDDYLAHPNSLKEIVENFDSSTNWLVTGCSHTDGHDHLPSYNEDANTIGSPSVLSIRKGCPLRFDNNFYWVLDLDFYKQCFRLYGLPKILNTINVVIGLGDHQTTHTLSDMRKNLEFELLKQKYDTSSKANN